MTIIEIIPWKSQSHNQATKIVGVLFTEITPLHQLCELQASSLLIKTWYKVMSHSNSPILPIVNSYIMSL